MSIPKIIHYCWFGGGAISPENRKCMESWEKYCPDYKIIEWNEQNFDISKNRYVQQAYEAKKYAFVSDYARLAVVYEYGGIYLDSDVEVLKSFDPLLDLPYFVGAENAGTIEAAIIGAEKGCDWIKACLDYYKGRNFIQESVSLRFLCRAFYLVSFIQIL